MIDDERLLSAEALRQEVCASYAERAASGLLPEQRDIEPQAQVKGLLRDFHLRNSDAAIQPPDADGVFPPAVLWNTALVVVDTNTLRNDLLYSCRRPGPPTTLVNGANSQILRLYCAQHVVEELNEHHTEWCDLAGIPAAVFRKRFKTAYAPLLRVVREVPASLLSGDEQSRVEKLRAIDADDIPSVTLAMLLGAFYMSEDLHACEAVYGVRSSSEEVKQWRAVLQAGGDAGVIGTLFEAGALLTGLLGRGVWGAFDKITNGLNPWTRGGIALATIGGAGFAYRLQPAERRSRIRDGLGRVAEVASAFANEYQAANARLNRAAPAAPNWEDLAADQDQANVLTRACLYQLARARTGHRSATELAEDLPRLGVGQSAPKVREVLRARPNCFEQVYRGRWQVGTAIIRAPRNVGNAQ